MAREEVGGRVTVVRCCDMGHALEDVEMGSRQLSWGLVVACGWGTMATDTSAAFVGTSESSSSDCLIYGYNRQVGRRERMI